MTYIVILKMGILERESTVKKNKLRETLLFMMDLMDFEDVISVHDQKGDLEVKGNYFDIKRYLQIF